MKFEPIEQRSDKWYAARLGKPSASQFYRIISGTTGNPAKKAAQLYMAELIGEKIFGRPMGDDISNIPAVRWGIETEPEARAALEERIGPTKPGGWFTDDDERYGASPDGIVIKGNRREICEIKCPYEIPQHIKTLLFGLDDKYRAQVQGQLWVSQYDVCHFWSYHPDCPPYYQKVERDGPFLRAMDNELDKFCAALEINYQRALKLGGWAK